jgi:hypothetical protein
LPRPITKGGDERRDRAGTGEEWVLQPELYGSASDRMNIMRLMKTNRVALVLLSLVMCSTPIVMAAPGCSVNTKIPGAARVFARASDQSAWQEYPSMEDVPELKLNGGLAAQFVQHKKNSPAVTIVKPGLNYWTYTSYCYASDGQLAGVSFEVRTQLGWGYRMEGTAFLGGFSDNTHEFFQTKDGKPIARPEGVSEAPAGLQPTLYLTVEQLPFASLLKTAANPGRKQEAAQTTSAMN